MIRPFIAHLLSSYYVPGTGDVMENKTDKFSIFKEMGNKQVNRQINL